MLRKRKCLLQKRGRTHYAGARFAMSGCFEAVALCWLRRREIELRGRDGILARLPFSPSSILVFVAASAVATRVLYCLLRVKWNESLEGRTRHLVEDRSALSGFPMTPGRFGRSPISSSSREVWRAIVVSAKSVSPAELGTDRARLIKATRSRDALFSAVVSRLPR